MNSSPSWKNLLDATWQAQRGKRNRTDVRAFVGDLDFRVAELRKEILSGRVTARPCRTFQIWDPKPRMICAPAFHDRVLHHAIISIVGPVLDRFLIDDTFACRVGKGTLAAVCRAQQHVRRFSWYIKMDIAKYFASINHEKLMAELKKRLKGKGINGLLLSVVQSHNREKGVGLPIGSLTSQHFANFFLGRFDRFCCNFKEVSGYVRYMDDFVLWCSSKSDAKFMVSKIVDFLISELALNIKRNPVVQQSRFGLTLCGFRIFASAIRLGRRRCERIKSQLRKWEVKYCNGQISSSELQQAADAILGIRKHVQTRLRFQKSIEFA